MKVSILSFDQIEIESESKRFEWDQTEIESDVRHFLVPVRVSSDILGLERGQMGAKPGIL